MNVMGEVRANRKSINTKYALNNKDPLGKAQKTNWREDLKKTTKLKHEN